MQRKLILIGHLAADCIGVPECLTISIIFRFELLGQYIFGVTYISASLWAIIFFFY